MDTLHVYGGDTLVIHWSDGDKLELVSDAIVAIPDMGSGTGTVTKVNNIEPVDGNVTLTAPDIGAASQDDFSYLEQNKVSYDYFQGRINSLVELDVFYYYIDQTQYSINQKASLVYVNSALASKADAIEVSEALATKATTTALNQVKALAEANQLNIGTKAAQIDLEETNAHVETNRLAILTKANITALSSLALLVNTKADQSYVQQQISLLVGSAPEALDTIYELAAAIQNEQGLIDALDQSVANRVRFDVATQALTALQRANARANIGAEEIGTAAMLVAQITAASIGAATAAQGDKADTAIQSGDLAPVALSGSFNSLINKSGVFSLIYSGFAIGANAVMEATDTVGQLFAKAQGQISANATAIATKADAANTLALINAKVSSVLLGVANGVATLGSDGKVPSSQLPAATVTWIPAADCITAKWSENLFITYLYFAKINGFLAVRGYIMGTGGGQVVPANFWNMKLKPAFWVYAPSASASNSQTGKKNSYLGSNSPYEFFAKNGTTISDTWLYLNEAIYGYGDLIYINDISLGRLINP